jgi:hypothetical protein
MKAAWYENQGAARDVLIVGKMDDPQPPAGEVRIRVAFSGVNPGDVKKREDAFGVGMPYPRVIPHSDGSATVDGSALGLKRYSQPLPLAGFQTFGDTLRSGRRRIHETTIERQDASAIHRFTPRRSCEDDRDGARTREKAHSARLR